MNYSRRRKADAPQPTDITVLLKDMLSHTVMGEQLEAYTLVERWSEVVGERVAKHIQVLDLQGKTLVLHATSAPWQAEANLQKKAIIVGCNTLLGKDRVHEIRFS